MIFTALGFYYVTINDENILYFSLNGLETVAVVFLEVIFSNFAYLLDIE
ncbi:MAG: hypothetical protein U9O98_07485 [Asgard group archaeon]|nr:hypothetical protein [Asgard group archaeon]